MRSSLRLPAAGLSALLTAVLLNAFATSVSAQYDGGEDYRPLNEKLPPGYTAEMMLRLRAADSVWLQPVRVELPTEGTVALYSATPEPLTMLPSPAQFSVNPGHFYRLRVSDLPELPGVEIYPSIEILDRLHPPAGMEANYPIPVVLTLGDLQEAINGRMVTRVIYLEQPQLASVTQDPMQRRDARLFDPANNALQEADRRGRPMIIVRIGGRTPDGPNLPLSFFGSGGGFDIGPAADPHPRTLTRTTSPLSSGLPTRALVRSQP